MVYGGKIDVRQILHFLLEDAYDIWSNEKADAGRVI